MRILRLRDHRRMPWKNGGGETIEIATSPDDASFETFDWRVSMARVDRAGPFSQFPGIDRNLSVIAGAGITLDLPKAGKVTLDRDSAPFFFSGDDGADCTLRDGPIDDLNVMTRRGVCRQRVTRHNLPARETFSWHGDAALVVLIGSADVVVGAETAALAPRDAVRFAKGDPEEFTAAPNRPAELFLIEFCAHNGAQKLPEKR